MEKNTFDAIVVGTGVSGGWAAKELTEKGLKTLVLDRGPMVQHLDYPTAMKAPWELPYGDEPTQEDLARWPKHTRPSFYGITQSTKHWFADDIDNPYEETKPFDWFRGYHVGGRSLMWGRQSYRFSQMDFEANGKEGVGADWPIRYDDLAPWYDHVEHFIGVSGNTDHLAQLPDGDFLPPMELNCVEKDFQGKLDSKFNRKLIIGRTANLSAPLKHDQSPQRGTCQYRNLCMRGCPFGGYFSSNSSTLPSAERTGNMTMVTNAIVYELIYDNEKGKATGVRVLDAETGKQTEYFARVIFMCASTFGTAHILMNSTSSRFPNGFGNDSGELGHNIMDHLFGTGARAMVDGHEDRYYSGRRPNGFYIPRYRNVGTDKQKYLRGFGFQGGAGRQDWTRLVQQEALGEELKRAAQEPGPWYVSMMGFGEMLPSHKNFVTLDRNHKDKYGLPVLNFDAAHQENEIMMGKAIIEDAMEMLTGAGYRNVNSFSMKANVGAGIHEMGTARMGRDPKTSVLNGWNQVHACKNVFVTDGSAMASSACQNPSLTYMALTARAANHAVEELKRGNL
ncbi:GMC family oxidoreductase [Luteibacter rhizovicinus DSM 16549]|uniref:GMC family oxidoreductase n=1 Tax=Luteibacter rhizovicinus DSM 16549 TaxID=1440763 RepID=A0A0G9HH96_9GAMM|nr:GMC family oxidoreductase [Luteibacter rhizovicinus]APG05575.1 GMC family oxidoreductase [Luteibacter rhizovicinus DSM 16549]KLD67032.1 GMC family oxidoreductase [Luteibacter rhizovicinus DSM 16549]KLD75055.1 GMC family oxidoreductase [Xanthomonas hyacinthi DSM 19077]